MKITRQDVAKPMALGAMTGTCSSFVLISSEVIKTRTQLSTTSVPSSQVMKEIMKTRGFSGLWVGMDAQIMRDAPFYAVFFGSYEIFKFTLHNMGVENRDVNYFMSGGFAGMVGWFVGEKEGRVCELGGMLRRYQGAEQRPTSAQILFLTSNHHLFPTPQSPHISCHSHAFRRSQDHPAVKPQRGGGRGLLQGHGRCGEDEGGGGGSVRWAGTNAAESLSEQRGAIFGGGVG